jgi:hypothetical protein
VMAPVVMTDKPNHMSRHADDAVRKTHGSRRVV